MGPSQAREVFQNLKASTIREVIREIGDTNWAKATKDEMIETLVKAMVGEDGIAEDKKAKRRTLAGSSREKVPGTQTAPVPETGARKRKHTAEEVEDESEASESIPTTRRATRRQKKDEEQDDSISAVRTTRSGAQSSTSLRVTTTKRKRGEEKGVEETGDSISDDESNKPPRRRLRDDPQGSESISSPARLTHEEAASTRTTRTKAHTAEESPSRTTRSKAQTVEETVSRTTRSRTAVDVGPSTRSARGGTRKTDDESPSRATRNRGATSARAKSSTRVRRAATSASDAEEEEEVEEEVELESKTRSTSPTKRGRGRPPKVPEPAEEEAEPEQKTGSASPIKRRGRPPKISSAAEDEGDDEALQPAGDTESASVAPAKRGRGRPKKTSQSEKEDDEAEAPRDGPSTDEPKRSRGRPPKLQTSESTEAASTSARAQRSIKRPNPYPAYASPVAAAKEKGKERASGKRSVRNKPGPASKARKAPQSKKPMSAKLDCVEVPPIPSSWKFEEDGEYDSDPDFAEGAMAFPGTEPSNNQEDDVNMTEEPTAITEVQTPVVGEDGYESSAGEDWTLELADGKIRGGRVEMNHQGAAEVIAEDQMSARIEEIQDEQTNESGQSSSARIEEIEEEWDIPQLSGLGEDGAQIEELQEDQEVPRSVDEGSTRIEVIKEDGPKEQTSEPPTSLQDKAQQAAVDSMNDGAGTSGAAISQSTAPPALEGEEQHVIEQDITRSPSEQQVLAHNDEQGEISVSQTPPALVGEEQLPDDVENTGSTPLPQERMPSSQQEGQHSADQTSRVVVDEGQGVDADADVEMNEASRPPAAIQDTTVNEEVVIGDSTEQLTVTEGHANATDLSERAQVQETTQEMVTAAESEMGTVLVKELVRETVVTTTDTDISVDEEPTQVDVHETVAAVATVAESEGATPKEFGLDIPQVEAVGERLTAAVDDQDQEAEGNTDPDTEQTIGAGLENPQVDLDPLVSAVGDPQNAESGQAQSNTPLLNLHAGPASGGEELSSASSLSPLDQYAGLDEAGPVEPGAITASTVNGDSKLTEDNVSDSPDSKPNTPSLHDLLSRPKESSGPSLMDLHSRPEQDDDFEDFGEEDSEIPEASKSQTTPSLLDLQSGSAEKETALPSKSKESSPQTPSLLDLHSRPDPGEEEDFGEVDPEDDTGVDIVPAFSMNGVSVGATPEALGMDVDGGASDIPSDAASAFSPEGDFGSGTTPEALGEVSLAPDEMYDYDRMDIGVGGDGFDVSVGDSMFDVDAHSTSTTGH